MKIHRIIANNFRHMKNVNIEFGEYLTVISGLNGTGKSSVLGLIGQLFDYKGKEKTVNNNNFTSIYSEILSFVLFMTKTKSMNILLRL